MIWQDLDLRAEGQQVLLGIVTPGEMFGGAALLEGAAIH